jgi:hypothetical protein
MAACDLVRKPTKGPFMPQLAEVIGCVTFRPGDGAPIEIPQGNLEVTLAPDSATLSWTSADGVAGLTAMPLTQFDAYVQDKKIAWKS